MITILLNDEPKILNRTSSLAEVLQEIGYETKYVAIAVNRNFIPNSQYQTTFLKEGDAIDVVAPMQGG